MVSRSLKPPEWSDIAEKSEDDIREYILTGYKRGKKFEPYALPLLTSPEVNAILDFGCGLGRNFDGMRALGAKAYAYDLPEMIKACAKFGEPRDITLLDTWEGVLAQRYDMAMAILVFQHIADPPEFFQAVTRLSQCSTYLYLLTRVYVDGTLKNTLAEVLATRQWEVISSSEAEKGLTDYTHPSQWHYDVVLRTKNLEQLAWSRNRPAIKFSRSPE
jgi:2-polyprenyl-3-methyl-5-hydroxy-6-metoxy-1,4-benzoquinol methylase